MSMVEGVSWAEEERSDAPLSPYSAEEQERRRHLATELEKQLAQQHVTPRGPPRSALARPCRTISTPTTASPTPLTMTSSPVMEDVKLKFMDKAGGLKPGGTSTVIPGPTYYRARSASSSATSRRSQKQWRYFNAEISKYINPHQVDTGPSLPCQIQKNGNVFFQPAQLHSKSEDLKNQCSLSNRLLNVMTIDDYQERYYGRRVKSASKYGHRISRMSSASSRTCTPDRPPTTGARTDSRPGSRPGSTGANHAHPNHKPRPASSTRAESGIYDADSDIGDDPTTAAWRDMPLEYFAMLEEDIDSDNSAVSRGFDVLMKANECVRNTTTKLYRDDPIGSSAAALSNSEGSEFFKRLKTTLRYQLLVGDGLPSRSRYQKALRMHQTPASEEQEVT